MDNAAALRGKMPGRGRKDSLGNCNGTLHSANRPMKWTSHPNLSVLRLRSHSQQWFNVTDYSDVHAHNIVESSLKRIHETCLEHCSERDPSRVPAWYKPQSTLNWVWIEHDMTNLLKTWPISCYHGVQWSELSWMYCTKYHYELWQLIVICMYI